MVMTAAKRQRNAQRVIALLLERAVVNRDVKGKRLRSNGLASARKN
jgi:hypothetical protein